MMTEKTQMAKITVSREQVPYSKFEWNSQPVGRGLKNYCLDVIKIPAF